jgi:hypothetical protein
MIRVFYDKVDHLTVSTVRHQTPAQVIRCSGIGVAGGARSASLHQDRLCVVGQRRKGWRTTIELTTGRRTDGGRSPAEYAIPRAARFPGWVSPVDGWSSGGRSGLLQHLILPINQDQRLSGLCRRALEYSNESPTQPFRRTLYEHCHNRFSRPFYVKGARRDRGELQILMRG